MRNNREHIDDLFRDGFKGLQEKPPVHAWNRLEEELHALGTGKRLRFFRMAAASILILLAFGAGYYFAIYNTNQNRDTLSTHDEIPLNVKEQPGSTPGELDQQQEDDSETPITDPNPPEMAQSKVRLTNSNPADNRTKDLVGFALPDAGESENVSRMNSRRELEIQRIEPADVDALLLSVSAQRLPIISKKLKTNTLLESYPIQDYSDIAENSTYKIYTWSVGAQFAPTYSYRDISTNYGTGATGNPTADEDYDAIEDPLLSYAGGVQIDYRVYGNWRLETGVYFSRIGQVNNDALQFKQGNNEYVLSSINTSTGGIDVVYEQVPESVKRINSPKDSLNISGVDNVKLIQQFDLFEIPFLVKYKMLNRKFSMHVSGGLSPAFLADNNTYLEMEDRKYDVGDAGNLNNMIVNTSLGIGLEYLITNKLSINLEPTFKYALNPINNNSNFSYHPYYFSWFTGIRLRID